MAATVFEPVNAQIRPAECTSIRQQKAKLKLREDMREERYLLRGLTATG